MAERTTIRIPGFRGEVVTPDHQEYGGARAVWNGTVDRRPRVIARCGGTADVATAVRFARDRELEHRRTRRGPQRGRHRGLRGRNRDRPLGDARRPG